jgi:hypothetical protein
MKKVFMLALVAFMTLAVSPKAHAIEDPNPKGTLVAGARFGIIPGFGANVVGDYTLVDSWWKGHFTVGGYFGFNNSRYHYDDLGYNSYRSNFINFALMPRVTYGLNITKDFEVHVGVMLGANYQIHKSVYDNGYTPDARHTRWYFSHGEAVGARYFFTDTFGVEAEFIYTGYQNYINVGVTFKL